MRAYTHVELYSLLCTFTYVTWFAPHNRAEKGLFSDRSLRSEMIRVCEASGDLVASL